MPTTMPASPLTTSSSVCCLPLVLIDPVSIRLGSTFGRGQLPARQITEHGTDGPVVLCRSTSRGCHEDALVTVVDHPQHGGVTRPVFTRTDLAPCSSLLIGVARQIVTDLGHDPC